MSYLVINIKALSTKPNTLTKSKRVGKRFEYRKKRESVERQGEGKEEEGEGGGRKGEEEKKERVEKEKANRKK